MMAPEHIDHRYLGAIEFVDAITGARIRDPLKLRSDRLDLRANRLALYVIHWAQGLEDHLDAFEAMPKIPVFEGAGEFELEVADTQQRYLARRARIKLPRKEAPPGDAASVLRPLKVPLYPSGARPVERSWAVLRASVCVVEGDRRVGVANAWLTLTTSLSGVAPATALTDAHGEALLAVTGVAPVRPAQDVNGALTRSFPVTLRVVLHEDMVHRADAKTRRPMADPDRIEEDLVARPAAVKVLTPPVAALAPGEFQRVMVEVAL
jgi:hypothetical protein